MSPPQLPRFRNIISAQPTGGALPLKDYLKSILEAIADAVIVVDEHGRIRMANTAAEKMLGHKEEDLAGQAVGILLPESTFIRNLDDCDTPLKTQARHKNGKIIPVELSGTKMKKDGTHSCICVIRDITTRENAEKQKQRQLRELEKSNRNLDDFAHIVSHDLREPLRGLQSFARLLLEDQEHPLCAEQREKLQTVLQTAQRMGELLDALLYYSRLERTGLSVGRTDINRVVKTVLDLCAIKIREAEALVEVPQPLPVIVCDRIRITEVFYNLIGNALKYCNNKGNRIEIGVTADHPRAAGELAFYVRDHGIGIPKKQLDAVFKMFKRLHPRDAYGGGTGSGLAIVQKIIRQHDGRIWAESAGEGQGTTFHFTIPQKNRNDGAF